MFIHGNTWAKTMVETVNTEAYAQATGTMLDTYLAVSAPFHEALEKAMLKTLEQLAMPSRADSRIAERMTHIEMRLDDLDAKLDVVHKLLAPSAPSPRRQPQRAPRTIAKKVARVKQAKRGKK